MDRDAELERLQDLHSKVMNRIRVVQGVREQTYNDFKNVSIPSGLLDTVHDTANVLMSNLLDVVDWTEKLMAVVRRAFIKEREL